MDFNSWIEVSPDNPKPPKDKKCQLLIMGEGHYIGPAEKERGLEFNFKPEGIRKIVAWRECE